MSTDLDLFEKLLTFLSLPLTGWTLAAFLLLALLRNRLARLRDKALDALATHVGGAWSYRRFFPRYCALIGEQHQTMRLVGLRTEEERRPRIEDAYVPIKMRPRHETPEPDVAIETLLESTEPVVILGDPGAGKSSALDYLALFMTKATGRAGPNTRGLFHRSRLRRRIPVFVPLRCCNPANPTLLDDIRDARTTILPAAVHQRMPRKFLGRALRRKQAVLLLDGLDEVAGHDACQSILRKIKDFCQIHPGNGVLVTCRKAGWRGGLQPEPRVLVTLPLDSQQQNEFVHRWYRAIFRYVGRGSPEGEGEIERRASRDAAQLLALLRSRERLSELASNPLLLSLVCLVHRQRRNLPRGRAELYSECIDILLFHWDLEDKDLNQALPSGQQKRELLRRIAYRMHVSGLREISRGDLAQLIEAVYPEILESVDAQTLIRQIEVRSGLMVERSIDRLAFSHLTFQESFVVDYFFDRPLAELTELDLTERSWREPVLLMCGRLRNPNPLIQHLSTIDPALALHAIAEADATRLDMEATEALVARIIGEAGIMSEAESAPGASDETMAAIVNLTSVERNPFGERVLAFVENQVRSADASRLGDVMDALCKSPTRATAAVLIHLLQQPDFSGAQASIVAALARIGDPAIFEMIDAAARMEIREKILFEVLVSCETFAATEELFLCYGFSPPLGREERWAETWARRLANPAVEAFLEKQAPPREALRSSGESDRVWPYRRSAGSALSCIVQRCISILSRRLAGTPLTLDDISNVAQYGLKVLVPLLTSRGKIRILVDPQQIPDVRERAPWAQQPTVPAHELMRAAAPLVDKKLWTLFHMDGYMLSDSWRFGLEHDEPISLDRPLIAEWDPGRWLRRGWLTLGNFLEKRYTPVRVLFRKIVFVACAAAMFASLVLVTLSIRSLLPPDGTYLGFWRFVPGAVWVAAAALLLGMIIVPAYRDRKDLGGAIWNLSAINLGFILIMLALPLAIPMMVAAFLGKEWYEGMVTGERPKRVVAVYLGAMAIIAAVIAAVAAFHAGIAGWLGSVGIGVGSGALAAAGPYFAAWARAFQTNEAVYWLREHPRGGEILGEFASVALPDKPRRDLEFKRLVLKPVGSAGTKSKGLVDHGRIAP